MAEEHGIDAVILEHVFCTRKRGAPDAFMSMRNPDTFIAELEDALVTEAPDELARIVVSGHGFERRKRLKPRNSAWVDDVAAVHDDVHTFACKALAKRRRHRLSKAWHMRVGDDADGDFVHERPADGGSQ